MTHSPPAASLALLDNKALPESVWLPKNVAEILERACDRNRARIVFHRADGSQQTLSYPELRDAALHAVLGVGPGERLLLLLDEPDVFLPRLWGCFLRGVVPVIASRNPDQLPEPDGDTALFIRTSGSTGEPKFVPLTAANIAASIAASAYVNGYRDDDTSLNALPLCHIGGLMRTIRDTYIGCVQVQASPSIVREDPLRWLDLMDEHRATLAWGPNAAFASVVAQRHELPSRRRWALDSLRSVYSSGEPVVPQTMHGFAGMLEPYGFRADSLRVAWGMTEACFATTSTSLEDAGTPVPGVSLRIVSDEGEVLRDGEPGHLEIRGPLVSGGENWLRTLDLGRITAGRLTVSGRLTEAIKIGGITYAPREIERLIETIPGVNTAIACGVETAEGEALAIFVDGQVEQVIPVIRAQIANAFQITARFVIPITQDQIPRATIGKIQRRGLRDRFAAGGFDPFRRWPFDLRALPASTGARASTAEHERAARIAEILGDVLRVPVQLDDDFFALGGSSLRVAQAASRIGCELVDLFSAPTPLLLAARLMRPSTARAAHLQAAREPIAIVGMACRFPGAPDVDAFWQLLTEGRDALQPFSEEELLASGIDRRSVNDPAYVRAGMILDDIETFDAEFFGIPARDAEIMDPQQRLLLECAWHALEDAGHPPSAEKRVGIYVGGRVSEYLSAHQPPLDLFGHHESPVDGFRRLVANDKDYLATRLAYALDCRGPAVTVQTACSTSLVAVHLACQSLLAGECGIALAGGASIRVPQKAGYLYTEGMIFSSDGRTRPFDADASGTLFGSGVGIVVLRRLADALADGDPIYAVIRGSAINNDGAGPKSAFTSPSHDGQAAVIAEALHVAGVEPSTVSYVEAHGTGTAVGDPIEIAALHQVFGGEDARPGSCLVGSVKSNIGHLVQAAGVASLIKTSLMLHHRTLVPSVNYRNPNPLIDFAATPFAVSAESRAWETDGRPLRAGVSAFGFGGTNAHVVVEEADSGVRQRRAAAFPPHSREPRILPLSAKSPAALRELVSRYLDHLSDDRVSLRDLCASAQNTRAHFPHRLALVASSCAEMREKLAAQTIRDGPPLARGCFAFLFTGQGTQYAGMGRRLYETNASFRRVIDAQSMSESLFGPDAAERLARTEIAQPAVVAFQAALTTVWREWGIDADVILGHSLGEITAAWAAGVVSLDDAMRFARARGELMEQTSPGMLATVLAPAGSIDANRYGVALAAFNDEEQTVISGSRDAVEAALADLSARGIGVRPMPGHYAFHSSLMEPILDELVIAAGRMTLSTARTRTVSTLTGTSDVESFAHPGYWRRQAREPVQFARALANANADFVVQIGPGKEDREAMLTTLATLYIRGADVRWQHVEQEPWHRMPLPSYPFQRKRFWIDRRFEQEPRRTATEESDTHPLVGRRLPSPLQDVQFKSELTADIAPFARDHWVYGVRPLVMVGQLEMMRAAVVGTSGAAGRSTVIENVVVSQPLLLSDELLQVQTVLRPDGDIRIFSSVDGTTWDLHSSANARVEPAAVPNLDLAAIRQRCTREISSVALYAAKTAKGADIGPGVKLVSRVWRGDGEVIAELALDEEAMAFATSYGAYPGMLDSIAQCGDLTLEDGDPSHADDLYLPTVVARIVFHDRLPHRAWLTLRRREDASGEVYGVDGEIADEQGRVLVSVEGLYFKRATPASLTREEPMHEIEWVPLDDAPARIDDGQRIVADQNASAEDLCSEALDVVQSMLNDSVDGPLWLITRGGQATGHETAPLSPAHAALVGFGRTVQREQPSLRCRLIDLDPAGEDDETGLRRAMMLDQDEVAVRAGGLYGRRLRPRRTASERKGAYAIRAGSERTIEGLTSVPLMSRKLGANEVEIEIYATGLNFRDVLNASGRIDGPLGYECSGVIARCGASVRRLAPGTAVMAIAMHSLASHVIVDERLVVAKPRNLGFASAAASVVGYLTAMYALLDKARLKEGERVLIHTAAGGVGQAAIHVARMAGAEVLATASRSKWALLRASGVEHIRDSRVTGFSRDLARVDVVLNTLGADFTTDNLAVLRPGGRMVDLGHPEVLDLKSIAAQAAAAQVEFINFHIAQDVGIADPDHMQTLLAALAGHLESGRLPALPCRTFPLGELRQAFEIMLRGAHVGKLAIVHPAAERSELAVRQDATYLITGGVGAIGLQLASWLGERGARHLALVSRRPPDSEAALAAIRALTERGAIVRCLQTDVADVDALREVLATIEMAMPPLRGIIHAAGAIDDGILSRQNRMRVSAVLAPKVTGAWNLHRLTESVPLDFFALVSSVAGLWGNPGQAGYAAANAFLDQLAHARRQRGLPATSIDFGAWQGAGMAAALSDAARERRVKSGASELEPHRAIRALESALAKDLTQVAVFAGTSPMLATVARAREVVESPAPEQGVPPQTAEDALERTRRQVASLCGGGSGVDVHRPLPELGLDSLTVLLLRGRLIAEFGPTGALPVIRFLEGHSVAELARMTWERASASAQPRPARSWTALTPIRETGSRTPVFLVPPAARTAMTFTALGRSVDSAHPVYAFNPLGLDGRTAPQTSVDDMVTHYVNEIRSLRPDGPYILGGMCFGGHVAWEMARRLTESGHDVPLLILFDSVPPLAQRFERSIRDISEHAVRYYMHRIRHHVRQRSLARALKTRVRLALRSPFGLDADGWTPDVEVSESLQLVIAAHRRASEHYRARTFTGDVLLLESEEFHSLLFHDRWRSLLKGELETVRFEGMSHVEILQEHHAPTLGRAVTERLASLGL